MTKKTSLLGAFWLMEGVNAIFTALVLMNIGLLVTDNPFIVAVSTMLLFLAMYGMLFLDKFKVTDLSFGAQGVGYYAGALLTMALFGIGKSSQSIQQTFSFLEYGTMHLMTSIRGDLTVFEEMWVTTVGIVAAEELMFLIGLPLSGFMILDSIARSSKNLKFLSHPLVQILLVILPVSLMFAYIHVGMTASIAFFMTAVIFRAVLIFVVYSDMRLNLIPIAMVVPAFAIGVHRFWNIMATTGGNISTYVTVMMTHPLGYVALGMQAVYAIAAMHYIFKKFTK